MDDILIYKNYEYELKDVDNTSRTIIQAFAKYDTPDADKDISRKGLFTKSWNENKNRIKHLLNHDVTKPVGKPENIYDEQGFAIMKSKIGTHKLGDDFLEMAVSGLITEASYGAIPTRYNKLKGGGRELLETKLMEISSLTHWGAQQFTPLLSVNKCLDKETYVQKLLKRSEALEKFCKSSTASDETIELLLLESKQLTKIIIDSSTYAASPGAPTPEFDALSILKNLKTQLQWERK